MNKVILLGRLVKDPEVRYSQAAEPVAVTRYTLAVNRRFKRDGESDADFIPCVAFGKSSEFAGKYFKKGRQVAIDGRIQVRSWDDQNGQRHWQTDVIVESQYFADSKPQDGAATASTGGTGGQSQDRPPDGFFNFDGTIDDDLPF